VSSKPAAGARTHRVAIVTGAARGIGRAVAERLGGDGYGVAIVDLVEPQQTAESLRDGGVDCLAAVGDVSSQRDMVRFTERVFDQFGQIDVLVNNAGISCIGAASGTTLEQWRRTLDVNLTGAFIASQHAGKIMLDARSGSIVNIASIAGVQGFARRSAYTASKHGLIGLTRALAAEWGGRGVRVNAVCPGWVDTPMDAADQESGGYSRSDVSDRSPMATMAAAEDVAAAVAFLADPQTSGFINGAAIPVDGGWTADGGWDSLRNEAREHRAPNR
jgi:NAD(P)-dependent dehydrogenase (short-subunit alcohol dehydrogenase family)